MTATCDSTRCTKTTKTGARCRNAVSAAGGSEQVCARHAPPVPRSIDAALTWRSWTRPVEPACWSWPLPEQLPDGRYGITLHEWHDGRCAMCGEGGGGNVCDHDHETARVRGYLCASCNTQEGMDFGQSRGWANYRRRPPAVILDVELTYVSIVTGPAVPAPPPPTMAELWKDHPFRGVL